MQLQDFKAEFLDTLLGLLWKQWSSIGVAGNTQSNNLWVIDPEALILFSSTLCRYDQRLFDEILDWIIINERFINVQRLKTLLKTEGFASGGVVNAIASQIVQEKSAPKWKSLAQPIDFDTIPQPLFFLKSGLPIPVIKDKDKDKVFEKRGLIRNPVQLRKHSKVFPQKSLSSLLLQIRGLMGVDSRSEILLYLMLNKKASIQEIATQTGYAWRSIQDALYEMGHSPVIYFPETKKGRVYHLNSDPWWDMFQIQQPISPMWICWSPFFRGMEMIWQKLEQTEFLNSSTLEQAADIKHLMDNAIIPKLVKAGLGKDLHLLSGHWGEEYLEKWLEFMNQLNQKINP